jgi:hypothetical protein
MVGFFFLNSEALGSSIEQVETFQENSCTFSCLFQDFF